MAVSVCCGWKRLFGLRCLDVNTVQIPNVQKAPAGMSSSEKLGELILGELRPESSKEHPRSSEKWAATAASSNSEYWALGSQDGSALN